MSQKDCVFCELSTDQIIDNNKLAVAIRDKNPVTPGHTLIIPKRHEPSFFDITDAETLACKALLVKQKHHLMSQDKNITSFNIGTNSGIDAGQSVFHCHIHLIPRRRRDVKNPKGGLRHLIPDKGNY